MDVHLEGEALILVHLEGIAVVIHHDGRRARIEAEASGLAVGGAVGRIARAQGQGPRPVVLHHGVQPVPRTVGDHGSVGEFPVLDVVELVNGDCVGNGEKDAPFRLRRAQGCRREGDYA